MSEWKEYSLKETADSKRFSFTDGDWIEAPYITDKGIRLIQTGNIGTGWFKNSNQKFISEKSFSTLKCKEVFPDDLLICRLADPIGRACKVPPLNQRFITSVDVTILRVDENRFSKDFIIHKINTQEFLDEANAISGGSTRQRISRGNLGKLKIKLPPLPVQRKIARILSTIDGQIEKTEAIIAKYQAIKQGMLQDLFTRGIDVRTGQLRPRYEDAPDLYKVSPLGMIPTEWEAGSLSSIAEINPPKSFKGLKNEDDVSFIRMEDVSNGGFWVNRNLAKLGKVKEGFTHFRNNDTLVAKITPCLENGKGALVESLVNGVGFGSTEFHVVRPFDEKSKYFIYFHTISPKFRQSGESQMVGSAGQQRIQRDFFTRFKIGIPPTPEQFKIGLRLKATDDLVNNESRNLTKLQLLKQGLMQDLLSGKVAVDA